MPLPSNVGTGTVVGKFLDLNGNAIAGTVKFTPTPLKLLNATSVPPVTILPVPVTVELDSNGAFSVALVATNDPQNAPVDWNYAVSFAFTTAALETFNINVPEGATVDLAVVAPVASSGGVVPTAVLTTNLDAQMKTHIDNEASLTRASLSATYVAHGALAIDVTRQPGATDNAKVQAAITAAVALGTHRIVIPPGSYTWAAGVTLPPVANERGIEIDARGAYISHTGADYAVTFGDGGATDARRHLFKGARIVGSASGLGAARFNHTRFCRFEDNEVSGYSTAAAKVIDGVGDIANYFAVIARNKINGGTAAIYLDGGTAGVGANSWYIHNNHISGVTVGVDNAGAEATRIRENEFNGSTVTSVRVRTASFGVEGFGNQHDGPTNSWTIDAGAVDTWIFGDTGGGTYTDAGTDTRTFSKLATLSRLHTTSIRNPGGNLTLLDSGGSTRVQVRTTDVTVTEDILPGLDNTYNFGHSGGRWKDLYLSGFSDLKELATDPAAPAADTVRFYAKDNGAGKTALYARFATGSPVLIATEP